MNSNPTAALAIALALAAFSPAASQTAAPAPAAGPSPGEIVAAAPAGDWSDIAASDLLVMALAPDAKGKPRTVVIQLLPAPFSQGWVSNIRTLASAHYWDGLSVYRVQDNYVTQWGDPEDDETKAKKLPAGLRTMTEADYVTPLDPTRLKEAVAGQRAKGDPRPLVATGKDAYSEGGYFDRGWAYAFNWTKRNTPAAQWPTHCYGMVGVARGARPSTGDGATLYTVIGHAPRHLDRNIALAGRIIEGMEHLSSLPRGPGASGFYTDATMQVPIVSVRLASELPAGEQPRFQYLSTETGSFAKYADARANRRDAFFGVPAGGADICNIPVPTRRKP